MKYFQSISIIIIFLLSICLSCSPVKKTARKGYLLDNNKITIDNTNISYDEISGFIQQKPNKKLLGLFRFYVWVYENANQGKDTRFKKWMKNSIGQKPVILDSILTNTSTKQIKAYLNNKGFFNSKISKNIIYKKKRAKIYYSIHLGQHYIINQIKYQIQDSLVDSVIKKNASTIYLKNGMRYDAYLLEYERDRLTNVLRNNGFFYFSKEYIIFNIDSSFNNNKLNINVIIKNKSINEVWDSMHIKRNHPKCYIHNIYIYPENIIEKSDSLPFDTIGYKNHNYIIYKDRLILKPKAVTRNIFIKNGKIYRLDDVTLTYNRLLNLKLIRFINFNFTPINQNPNLDSTLLDCHIELSRSPLQGTTLGVEGTNKGGYLGIAGFYSYQNINIFHGAEIFNIKLKGALEMQKNIGKAAPKNELLFFNTIETGIETSLDLPRLLHPFKQERISKFSGPKTSINTGFNFQLRPYYKRYITNLSYGYEWKQSETTGHIFFPFEINSVRIFPSNDFKDYLNSLKDPRYIYQYTDHLIMALKYSYIFSNQGIHHRKNSEYFRLNFESSGNVLNLYSKYIGGVKDSKNFYTLFNIRYAQYVRGDFDFRYYNQLDSRNLIVLRTTAGVGYAYGNSKSLPFEKGFYAGGANDMRGWRIRSLGPGSFQDTASTNFDKMGDILMEANFEYRFPIYRFFKGAFFSDAGNVWTLKNNEDFPNGKFDSKYFIEQIAIDAGFGLRLDFGYFNFRIDGALPLRDPSKEKNDRWINPSYTKISDVMWNFAIGYPF